MAEPAGVTLANLPHRRGEGVLVGAVWLAVLAVSAIFLWMLSDLLRHGLAELSWAYFTQAPYDAGRAGGIAPIISSTLGILAVTLAVSVPLGLGTAVLLAELAPVESRFGHLVRRSLDVLAGVPSIVFGLFGNAFFCVVLGLGFSILSGGLTLACMALPLLVRSIEEGLRAVPNEIRLGAAALGLRRSTAIVRLLLPAAAPSVAVGLVLGIGRALAETAALIFTSGYVDRAPRSLYDSGRALSIHIYDLAMNVAGGEPRAYAAALVLVVLLLAINQLANTLTERWHPGGV